MATGRMGSGPMSVCSDCAPLLFFGGLGRARYFIYVGVRAMILLTRTEKCMCTFQVRRLREDYFSKSFSLSSTHQLFRASKAQQGPHHHSYDFHISVRDVELWTKCQVES